MSSKLKEAVLAGNKAEIKKIISELKAEKNWSLTSFIDQLVPVLLMETNLKYGNFHSIKMALFLREMAVQDYFSRATEQEMISFLARYTEERRFLQVTPLENTYQEQKAGQKTEAKLIESLNTGNVHNAYYYAQGLWKYKPNRLQEILLKLGTQSIPATLGHSFSCFYPIVRDLLSPISEQAETALLTTIMYLARFDYKNAKILDSKPNGEAPQDFARLTKICASGGGIVNLHQMITLYLFRLWEVELGRQRETIPYSILLDWLGDKSPAKDEIELVDNIRYCSQLPKEYSQFKEKFAFTALEDSLGCLFPLLEEQPSQAIDWLYNLYAENYFSGWDPHYYTGLYCGLGTFLLAEDEEELTAGKLAVYQALRYFAEALN